MRKTSKTTKTKNLTKRTKSHLCETRADRRGYFLFRGIKREKFGNHRGMIKNTTGIKDAKMAINSYFNKDVEVKVNLGRNKELTFCGKLTGIYPALFTVSPFEKDFKGKTSYSYSEFLCGTVSLKALG